MAIAALCGVLAALNAAGVRTAGDLYVASNTGEEGLGDLRGMKTFIADVKDRVGAAIAIEGVKINRIVHVAVGSRRFRITFRARGGHSWADFPSPSAIHIMSRAIAEISHLEVPTDPKTTYNVGLVQGGTSVNTIAAEAEMTVDMRSTAPDALADLERRLMMIVKRAAEDGHGQVEPHLVGDRPAGVIPATHPVIETCAAIHRVLGLEVYTEPASTDHNVPLALGIPGVCLSITEGANEHRFDEDIDTEPIPLGVKKILLAAVVLAGGVVRADATATSERTAPVA